MKVDAAVVDAAVAELVETVCFTDDPSVERDAHGLPLVDDEIEKALSAAERRSFDVETERIKANRTAKGARSHKFRAAKWTHPNGHPRCLLCGDEQRLPDGFDTTGVPFEKWLTAPCTGSVEKAGSDTSAMVALYPTREIAEALAIEGGEPVDELHITLTYLGPEAVTKLDREKVEAAVAAVAANASPLTGEVSGLGRFNAGYPAGQEPWPLYASIDLPALPAFRQRLVGALEAAGVEVVSNHGFSPHLTLAYVEPGDEDQAAEILTEGIDSVPLSFGEVVLAWGEHRQEFPLGREKVAEKPAVAKAVAGPVVKSDAAARYTFGPMYLASPEIPSARHLDAHGDMATADDLQKAVWDYVRSGDRQLNHQHYPGVNIGEWVELVSWPYEVTLPITKADGSTEQKSYAPGTVFMGAIWSPEGWALKEAGKITGYSLEGMATRIDVEMAAE